MGRVTHDQLVRDLREAVRAVDLRAASDAFLASLVTGPRRGRNPLAHVAYATNFPDHTFLPNLGAQSYQCAVCGASEDEDVDREGILESLEEGDTLVASPAHALVDLQTFADLPPVRPAEEDIACFDAMLDGIASLPPEGRGTDLVKRWKVPRTNAYARAGLVETLGACGVLETADHPGHLTRWVGFWEYEEVPRLSGEARPPEAWWRGSDGVRRRALDHVFPQAGIGRERFPEVPLPPRALEPRAVKVPKKGRNPALELLPGDLLGIEFLGRWVAGVVLGGHSTGTAWLPVIEFFDRSFEARPDGAALTASGARLVGPYREAPHLRREPLALEGLELFGPVMPVKLEVLGRSAAPPSSDAPATPLRVVAERNLLYLLASMVARA